MGGAVVEIHDGEGCSDMNVGTQGSDAGSGTTPASDECGNGLEDDGDGRVDEDCFCGPEV